MISKSGCGWVGSLFFNPVRSSLEPLTSFRAGPDAIANFSDDSKSRLPAVATGELDPSA